MVPPRVKKTVELQVWPHGADWWSASRRPPADAGRDRRSAARIRPGPQLAFGDQPEVDIAATSAVFLRQEIRAHADVVVGHQSRRWLDALAVECGAGFWRPASGRLRRGALGWRGPGGGRRGRRRRFCRVWARYRRSARTARTRQPHHWCVSGSRGGSLGCAGRLLRNHLKLPREGTPRPGRDRVAFYYPLFDDGGVTSFHGRDGCCAPGAHSRTTSVCPISRQANRSRSAPSISSVRSIGSVTGSRLSAND
jgi:hypothetical protein